MSLSRQIKRFAWNGDSDRRYRCYGKWFWSQYQTNLHYKVHPTDTYLGLQIGIDVDDLRPNVEYPVSGIVVDWDGNRKKDLAAVEVQLSEIDYSYNWSYNEESRRYEMSTKRFELLTQGNRTSKQRSIFSEHPWRQRYRRVSYQSPSRFEHHILRSLEEL